MNVKELIKELKKVDGKLEVYLSSDAEGNEISSISESYSLGYVCEGEVIEPENEEDIDFIKDNKLKKSIVFYPI